MFVARDCGYTVLIHLMIETRKSRQLRGALNATFRKVKSDLVRNVACILVLYLWL